MRQAGFNSKTNTPDGRQSSWTLEPQALHRYALLVGLASIALAILIGLASYIIVISTAEKAVYAVYLNKAKMLVAAASSAEHHTDTNLLAHVLDIWNSSTNKPDDEYICITDADANLILHSSHPETVGKCAGANLLLGNSKDTPDDLLELIKSKSDYVGEYISSSGQEQIAAFSYLPDRGWSIGVHRSKAVLDSQIRNIAIPFIAGFSGIILLLLPISLVLNYKAFMGTLAKAELAEKSVATSEKVLQLHVANTPIGIIHWNLDFEITAWNPAAEKIFGFKAEETIGRRADFLVSPESMEHVEKVWTALLGQAGGTHSVNENITKDGRTILCEWNNSPLENERGQVYAVAGMVTDITERKQAVEALQVSEAKYKSLFDNIQSGFALHEMVVDEKGVPVDYVFLDVNPAFETMTNLSRKDLLGKRVTEVLPGIENDPADWIGTYGKVAQTGQSISFENFAELLKKWYSVVAYSPKEGQVAVLFHDITLRKHLEEQIRQTQKLEAIGTLAGGIAHDFNNLLFAILGYAELAEEDIPKNNPAQEYLQEIIIAGHRASELVHQILTFARRADKSSESIQVSLIVEEAAKMLRATLPTTIDIQLRLNSSNTNILADPTEIHQVIMNLCTNAGHALMEKGGVLEIGLSKTEIDEPALAKYPDLQIGTHLVLVVGDNGPGIAPEIINNIFEPFFTTKGVGVGTGMGLAVVHGIVNSLGGTITVQSEVGQGTVFKILLPLEVASKKPLILTQGEIPQGTETILVVDDEPTIAKVISGSLISLGYTVDSYTDSQKALKAFLDSPETYSLIITDQTMPKLTGAQLATEILVHHPTQPIILCTGFSQTMPAEKADRIGIAAYLKKPSSKQELGICVRQVLDKQSDQPQVSS